MRGLVARSGWRHFRHHPFHTLLALMGIALGVAGVVAVDVANQGAMASFTSAMEAANGRATHHVLAVAGSLDERLLATMRVEWGVYPAAPVVEGTLVAPSHPGVPFRLLGVDPLSEAAFRPHLGGVGRAGNWQALLTQPGAVFVSERMGMRVGERIVLEHGPYPLQVAGVIPAADPLLAEGLLGVLIADISTAQEVLGLSGKLSRIDVILGPGEGLKGHLPAGVTLVQAAGRRGAMAAMTASFRLNLTALSLLALLVGLFIIHNAMAYSVIRRRRLLALLRAQGVTGREILQATLVDALLLAVPGTLMGVLLGALLGERLLLLVTRTINDLYFSLPLSGMGPSVHSLLKGFLLGVGGGLLAAWPSAREAASLPVSSALSVSAWEERSRDSLPRTAALGALLMILGGGVVLIPVPSVVFGFAALFFVMTGYALMVPQATARMIGWVRPWMGRSVPGALAAGGALTSLSRTGVAVAALVVAVSATIGMGILIVSFRGTVAAWLDVTLASDIYVSASGPRTTGVRPPLDPELVEALAAVAGVGQVGFSRRLRLETGTGPLELAMFDIPAHRFAHFRFKDGPDQGRWSLFQDREGVLLSEPLAFRRGLRVGQSILLPTRFGEKSFSIIGIYDDYGSDAGVVALSGKTFRKHWQGDGVTSMGIEVTPGTDPALVVAALRRVAGERPLLIRENRELREASLALFDRTFAITRVLRLLALVVAFFGILTALSAIQMDRMRELALLRAVGVTAREGFLVMTAETGVLGLCAGLLAIPLGWLQGVLLIEVINYRSFGWSLTMSHGAGLYVDALLLAVPTALLAGVWPAWRLSRTPPGEVLREDA